MDIMLALSGDGIEYQKIITILKKKIKNFFPELFYNSGKTPSSKGLN